MRWCSLQWRMLLRRHMLMFKAQCNYGDAHATLPGWDVTQHRATLHTISTPESESLTQWPPRFSSLPPCSPRPRTRAPSPRRRSTGRTRRLPAPFCSRRSPRRRTSTRTREWQRVGVWRRCCPERPCVWLFRLAFSRAPCWRRVASRLPHSLLSLPPLERCRDHDNYTVSLLYSIPENYVRVRSDATGCCFFFRERFGGGRLEGPLVASGCRTAHCREAVGTFRIFVEVFGARPCRTAHSVCVVLPGSMPHRVTSLRRLLSWMGFALVAAHTRWHWPCVPIVGVVAPICTHVWLWMCRCDCGRVRRPLEEVTWSTCSLGVCVVFFVGRRRVCFAVTAHHQLRPVRVWRLHVWHQRQVGDEVPERRPERPVRVRRLPPARRWPAADQRHFAERPAEG